MSSDTESGPHPPERAQDARGGGEADTAATATPQPFTLDITFSGLCLLVRQTTAKKLLILLPHAHSEGGEMPEHLMVLGAHGRYRPAGPFQRKGQFREYVLTDGDLAFVNWTPVPSAELALPASVADLTTLAEERPPLPEHARLRWPIPAGHLCAECARDEGAVWRFAGSKRRMATRLAWRIPGVTATVGGQPGLRIRFTTVDGGEQEFVIRPAKEADPDNPGTEIYRAALYLYHTPADELPSHAGHPSEQAEEDGDENHHFGAYYGLFIPNLDEPLPVRVPEEEEEDEQRDQELGRQASTAARTLSLAAASRLLHGYQGFHGRLYTCTLATSEDTETPAESTLAADVSRAADQGGGADGMSATASVPPAASAAGSVDPDHSESDAAPNGEVVP